ncbi:MAG: hypothetical protein ACK553_18480 [Planctomycetota bacterium]|jgi:hypothetical protein
MAKAAKESFEEKLREIPLDFIMPARVREELQRKGVGTAMHDDNRESPRFRTNGPAIFSWESSPPAFDHPHPTRQVIVRDLSRTGVGILTSTQWFPEESGKLEFAIGSMIVKVMRARRLGPRCFEIGARIIWYARDEANPSEPD